MKTDRRADMKSVDELADEIVELLLDYANSKNADAKNVNSENISSKSGAKRNALKKGGKRVSKSDILKAKNLMEIAKLRNRMNALENRTEKFIKSLKISSIEAGRLVSEKAEEAKDENEQLLFDLQGQIEDLRDAMVKLSNQVKKLSSK